MSTSTVHGGTTWNRAGYPFAVAGGAQHERLAELVVPEQLPDERPPRRVLLGVRVVQPVRRQRRRRVDEIGRHRRQHRRVEIEAGPRGVGQRLEPAPPVRGRPLGRPTRPRRRRDRRRPRPRRTGPLRDQQDTVGVAGHRGGRADGARRMRRRVVGVGGDTFVRNAARCRRAPDGRSLTATVPGVEDRPVDVVEVFVGVVELSEPCPHDVFPLLSHNGGEC